MKTSCTLSNEELLERCRNEISKLCKSGGKAWSMRVPVDFNNDSDMLFSELIKRFKSLDK